METRPREAIIGKTHWEAYPGSEESQIGQFCESACKVDPLSPGIGVQS